MPINSNALSIANFLLACRVESNISSTYREDLIFTLCKLSNYLGKNFKDFTREDVLAFLDSYRKTEPKDPLHGWIGSYNLHRGFIIKFFRWLYYPDVKPKDRPKPSCVDNIPNLKKKGKKHLQTYRPMDRRRRPSILEILSLQTRPLLSCYFEGFFLQAA